MATVTKSFKENQTADIASTWTVNITGADYNVTTVSQTLTVNSLTATAKYVASGKGRCFIQLDGSVNVTSSTGSASTFEFISKRKGTITSPAAIASNTLFTVPNYTSWSGNISATTLFSSSNPTIKTQPITISSVTAECESQNASLDNYNRYYGTIFSSNIVGYVYYKCPPVLNTCSISKDTPAGYYAGLTKVTVSVPITYSASGTTGTAKYGGYIKQIDFTIGGQTVTKTFTESTKPTSAQTLSILLNAAGTSVPVSVTVTDSRDQTTTQSLTPITVEAYNVPSVSFDVYRTNDVGIKNDEGHYALIQSTISYTDGAATLTEPSIQIDGVDLSSLTDASVTWYKTWSNTNGVSNVISDWATLVPQNHMVTIYGLIDWDYDTTGNFAEDTSYQITLVATDSLNGQSTPITQTMSTAFYTIDFQAGGKEIAFGAPANDNLTSYPNGLFKCEMDAHFVNDVEIESPYLTLDTTAQAGTKDGDLYIAIVDLGWDSDVIV